MKHPLPSIVRAGLMCALLLAACLLPGLPARAAQLYRVGDIVEDFTLVNRATGQPMRLHDFQGKIVLLDWFAWWCPYCQAAAPQLLEGIDDYYRDRHGNPAGIEVVHVGVNLQSGQEPQTQNFVERARLDVVLQDFNRSVANRFASSGQPIFAIINGVANSPGHPQWELLYSQPGYGQTQFPIASFRAAIDSVTLPSLTVPSITAQPLSQTVPLGDEVILQVAAAGSEPLQFQWRLNGSDIPEATTPLYRLDHAQPTDAGQYTVQVSNPAGSVISAPATLSVLLPVSITSEPTDLSLSAGDDASFSLSITGDEPLTFQWRWNGHQLAGANTPILLLPRVTEANAGVYSVTITGPFNAVESRLALLTVRPAPATPTTLMNPRLAPDASLLFEFAATPGRSYRIEVSSDLVEWTRLDSVVATSDLQTVRHASPLPGQLRFYRLVSE